MLDPVLHQDMNYSGCGNTMNGSHAVCKRLIIDSLYFWRNQMHVDGFRFDLASILSRDQDGHPLVNPPTLLAIDTDPVLANCKMIAEAWDAGGLYQVGSLAGSRWREWNGQFSRITSYNVCYTKLLRVTTSKDAGRSSASCSTGIC